MPNPILIIHGWSDNYESFKPLKGWFNANGYKAEEVLLGNYESMEDHVTFDDLAVGFQVQLDALVKAGRLPALRPHALDVVVHSTGGPVFRHWLNYYLDGICRGDRSRNPIRSVVMLAPANFGSRLAAQGKSALAMLFKGGVSHGFQTGRLILEGLELGSPVLWRMAERDLFCDASIYPTDPAHGPFVFVLSGTATYGELKGLVAKGANEDGSDGTIRASAAALNSIKVDLDFTDPANPGVAVKMQRNEPFAFRLVPDKNHSTVVPRDPAEAHPTLSLIQQCLAVKDLDQYRVLRQAFEDHDQAYYAAQQAVDDGERVHAHQQFVFRVRDELGNTVPDYRIDFHVVDGTIANSAWGDEKVMAGLKRYQDFTRVLQDDVIVDVQPHSKDPSYRTFFVNLDRLAALREELRQRAPDAYIAMNLDAAGPTPDLTYDTDRLKYLPVDRPIGAGAGGQPVTFFCRNTTTLVDIQIQRVPTNRIFAFPA
jgi:lipase (class 2)